MGNAGSVPAQKSVLYAKGQPELPNTLTIYQKALKRTSHVTNARLIQSVLDVPFQGNAAKENTKLSRIL